MKRAYMPKKKKIKFRSRKTIFMYSTERISMHSDLSREYYLKYSRVWTSRISTNLNR